MTVSPWSSGHPVTWNATVPDTFAFSFKQIACTSSKAVTNLSEKKKPSNKLHCKVPNYCLPHLLLSHWELLDQHHSNSCKILADAFVYTPMSPMLFITFFSTYQLPFSVVMPFPFWVHCGGLQYLLACSFRNFSQVLSAPSFCILSNASHFILLISTTTQDFFSIVHHS